MFALLVAKDVYAVVRLTEVEVLPTGSGAVLN